MSNPTAAAAAAALLQAVENYDMEVLNTNTKLLPLRWTFHNNSSNSSNLNSSNSSNSSTSKQQRPIPLQIYHADRVLPADLFVCMREEERKLLGNEYDSGSETETSVENNLEMMAQSQSHVENNLEMMAQSPSSQFLSPSLPSVSIPVLAPFNNPPSPPVHQTCPSYLSERVNYLFRPRENIGEMGSSGTSIMYLCHSSPRILNNDALTYSLLLAKILQLPIMIVIVVSPETLSGERPSNCFLKSALERFAFGCRNKLGVPVLPVCCNDKDVDSYRTTMKLLLQGFTPNTVVMDNTHNKRFRPWPPPTSRLSDWCHSDIVEVETLCLCSNNSLSSRSLSTSTTSTSTLLPDSITDFDKKLVAPAVGKWRNSQSLLKLLSIGIGLTPGKVFQPHIQQTLLLPETSKMEDVSCENVSCHQCQLKIPANLLGASCSSSSSIVLLSLNDLKEKQHFNGGKKIQKSFNNQDGSESSALLAVARLVRALLPATTGGRQQMEQFMRSLESNPSEIGQEQIMNFIRVGSLSKRTVIDLLLGHRSEAFHCSAFYHWIDMLTTPRHITNLFTKSATCCGYIIYNSISVPEFNYFKFIDRYKSLHLNNTSRPPKSHALWQALVEGSEVGINVVIPHVNQSRHYAGAIEKAQTSDRVFNCLQYRLISQGDMHPTLLISWISRMKTLLNNNSFQTFDLVMLMLRRYYLGAPCHIDVVMSGVVQAFNTTLSESESQLVGRECWDALQQQYISCKCVVSS